MNKITLQNALPQVFIGKDYIDSDVWHKDVELEKDIFTSSKQVPVPGNLRFAAISTGIVTITKASSLLTETIFVT